MAIELVSAATSATTGTAKAFHGGKGWFRTSGTFDTATVKLQVNFDTDSVWYDVASHTAPNVTEFEYPNGTKLRADVSSVGATTSVSAFIETYRE